MIMALPYMEVVAIIFINKEPILLSIMAFKLFVCLKKYFEGLSMLTFLSEIIKWQIQHINEAIKFVDLAWLL